MTPRHHSIRPTIQLAHVDEATWEVRDDRSSMGYVHRAGMVFVSLAGPTLSRAVEVGQSLSLTRAIELLGARRHARMGSA